MIAQKYRFHGHGSLRYVNKNAKPIRSNLATLKAVPNNRRKFSRLAVVVSKKTHKSAVGRNRIRRRVYEYLRQNLDNFSGVHDVVVVIVNAEVRTMSAKNLKNSLNESFCRAGLFSK